MKITIERDNSKINWAIKIDSVLIMQGFKNKIEAKLFLEKYQGDLVLKYQRGLK
jgi:hypothetical protein